MEEEQRAADIFVALRYDAGLVSASDSTDLGPTEPYDSDDELDPELIAQRWYPDPTLEPPPERWVLPAKGIDAAGALPAVWAVAGLAAVILSIQLLLAVQSPGEPYTRLLLSEVLMSVSP